MEGRGVIGLAVEHKYQQPSGIPNHGLYLYVHFSLKRVSEVIEHSVNIRRVLLLWYYVHIAPLRVTVLIIVLRCSRLLWGWLQTSGLAINMLTAVHAPRVTGTPPGDGLPCSAAPLLPLCPPDSDRNSNGSSHRLHKCYTTTTIVMLHDNYGHSSPTRPTAAAPQHNCRISRYLKRNRLE